MYPDDPASAVRYLTLLRAEHRDLDVLIAEGRGQRGDDELELKRLKKRKLQIKDTILLLQSRLIPDLDA